MARPGGPADLFLGLPTSRQFGGILGKGWLVGSWLALGGCCHFLGQKSLSSIHNAHFYGHRVTCDLTKPSRGFSWEVLSWNWVKRVPHPPWWWGRPRGRSHSQRTCYEKWRVFPQPWDPGSSGPLECCSPVLPAFQAESHRASFHQSHSGWFPATDKEES